MIAVENAAPTTEGFWSTCKASIVAVGVIGLVVAPFTSVAVDVDTWMQVVRNAMEGHTLYWQPGFSYPPLWGYFLEGLGGLLREAGISVGALTHTSVGWQVLAGQSSLFSASVSTPSVTLLFKLPLMAAEITTGWAVWSMARTVGADASQAKLAASMWLWCPVVLWETDVHGAFDVLVSLAVAAAVLGRLHQKYFWSGGAAAIGVLLKLTPVFIVPLLLATCLWPLTGENPDRRWRSLGATAAGGAAASAVLLAPVVLSEGTGALFTDVFSRTAAPSSVGGLAALGFSAIPALSWIASWALQPGSPVTRIAEMADLAVVVAGVLTWWRGPRSAPRVVGLSAVVLLAVIVVGPVANPQYLLWCLPLLVALSWRSRAGSVAVWLLGVAGVAYEVSLRGPLGFFGPLWSVIGIPGPRRVTAQMQWLTTHTFLGIAPGQALEVTSWAIATAGIALGAVSALRSGRGPAPQPGSVTRSGTRRIPAWTAGILAVLGVVTSSAPAWAGPLPSVYPALQVGRAGGDQVVRWHLIGGEHSGVRFALMSSRRWTPVRQVAIYDAPSYPDSGSTAYQVQGVYNHLPLDLSGDGVDAGTVAVGARGLVSWLAQRPASGRVLVMASGTLPDTVWGPHRDDLVPFLVAGGVVVWGGDLPGFYSVGRAAAMTMSSNGYQPPVYGCGPKALRQGAPLVRAAKVVGLDGTAVILGVRGLLPTDWGWLCNASQPSPVAESLGLLSTALHAGMPTNALGPLGGRSLGYVEDGRTSIAWVPRGGGGIVLFGGQVDAIDFSSDVAQLLQAGGAQPDLSVLSTSTRSQGVAAFPCGRYRRVEAVVDDVLTGQLSVRTVSACRVPTGMGATP